MRNLLVLLILCAATPALAALPPQYYEQARREAGDVVVLEMESVDEPPQTTGYGACAVHGRVIGVERGTSYELGAPISIDVPCRFRAARSPIGGVLYHDFETLREAPYGRAYLNGGVLALSQYELLREWTGALPAP